MCPKIKKCILCASIYSMSSHGGLKTARFSACAWCSFFRSYWFAIVHFFLARAYMWMCFNRYTHFNFQCDSYSFALIIFSYNPLWWNWHDRNKTNWKKSVVPNVTPQVMCHVVLIRTKRVEKLTENNTQKRTSITNICSKLQTESDFEI